MFGDDGKLARFGIAYQFAGPVAQIADRKGVHDVFSKYAHK
jgi:hypothetical protein